MEAALPLNSPFAALLAPQEVLDAVEGRGLLRALKSRVFRPLDKPLIPPRDGRKCFLALNDDLLAHDAAIDAEVERRLAELAWNGENTPDGKPDFVDTRG